MSRTERALKDAEHDLRLYKRDLEICRQEVEALRKVVCAYKDFAVAVTFNDLINADKALTQALADLDALGGGDGE